MKQGPRLPDTIDTVPAALAHWAAVTPEAVALLAPGREPITYRHLQEAIDRFAGELSARGLGRQDGIALILPEGPDLCLALLGAMTAGIAVPLPWPSPASELERALASDRVRAVVHAAEVPAALAEAKRGLPRLTFVPGLSGRLADFRLLGEGRGEPPAARPAAAEDIALILRSSGTTGRPKLVPRLHRGLIAASIVGNEARAVTAADRCLTLARTVYAQGSADLLTSLYAGASLIRVPSPDIAALPAWVREFRPTWLSVTPAILRAMAADRGDLLAALREAPLRLIRSTAGALSSDEAQRLEAAIGVPILNIYGMTEAAFIAAEVYPGRDRTPGSVGRPMCEVRIANERGKPVAHGSVGEIVVRGPFVVPGYLDDAEATARAFLPGGWFRTGDLGYLDEAGFLHLTGRLGEMVNRGGEMIAPGEIDEALISHPAVADAAAFPVPDELLGSDIVAAVVLKAGMSATARELRRWMLDRLSASKAPRRIWFVSELPRTETGKVQRGELGRLWGERRVSVRTQD